MKVRRRMDGGSAVVLGVVGLERLCGGAHAAFIPPAMLESLDLLISFAVIMTLVSLLITVIVQMTSAALNLRGRNLARGLVETFLVPAPDAAPGQQALTREQAQRLAAFLLTRSGLSDSPFRTLGELTDPAAMATFSKVGNPLGGQVPWALASVIRPEELVEALRTLASLGSSGGLPPGAASLVESARTVIRSFGIETIAGDAKAVSQRFRFWFQSGQDRAQLWFTTHTRWWTAGLSLAAAFYLQLDAAEIFRTLSRNPGQARALAAQASAVTTQAERVLDEGGRLYADAVQRWLAQQTNAEAAEVLRPLEGIDFTVDDTRATAAEKVGRVGPGDDPRVVGTFDDALDEVVADRLRLKQSEFATLRRAFDLAGYDLIPSDGGWRWGRRYRDGFESHLPGMLLTAALLTLGAPFWFNTLRSLTNLRSSLAEKLDDEQKGKGREKPDGVST